MSPYTAAYLKSSLKRIPIDSKQIALKVQDLIIANDESEKESTLVHWDVFSHMYNAFSLNELYDVTSVETPF